MKVAHMASAVARYLTAAAVLGPALVLGVARNASADPPPPGAFATGSSAGSGGLATGGGTGSGAFASGSGLFSSGSSAPGPRDNALRLGPIAARPPAPKPSGPNQLLGEAGRRAR